MKKFAKAGLNMMAVLALVGTMVGCGGGNEAETTADTTSVMMDTTTMAPAPMDTMAMDTTAGGMGTDTTGMGTGTTGTGTTTPQ